RRSRGDSAGSAVDGRVAGAAQVHVVAAPVAGGVRLPRRLRGGAGRRERLGGAVLLRLAAQEARGAVAAAAYVAGGRRPVGGAPGGEGEAADQNGRGCRRGPARGGRCRGGRAGRPRPACGRVSRRAGDLRGAALHRAVCAASVATESAAPFAIIRVRL